MLAVAREFGKLVRFDQLAVDEQGVEIVTHGPLGDLFVVSFARFDQRGKDLHRSGLGEFAQLPGHFGQGRGLHGNVARGTKLRAELGIEQAKEVVDLGDGGDGRFAAAARDALFDSHGGRQPRDVVHVGFFHLLDELTRIGRHAVEEAALSFGKENVEG